MLCTKIVVLFCFEIQNNIFTQHIVNFTGNLMNNLSSYCGLTDSRMRASEKDLPVAVKKYAKLLLHIWYWKCFCIFLLY